MHKKKYQNIIESEQINVNWTHTHTQENIQSSVKKVTEIKSKKKKKSRKLNEITKCHEQQKNK